MAGKIVADTLEHSTAGSLDTQYVVNGSIKAFGQCDATGTSHHGGTFNVSSITDSGTSGKVFNYTNTFSSATNSGIGERTVGERTNSAGFMWTLSSGAGLTASSIQIQYYDGSNYTDTLASFYSTGDLA